MRYWGYFAAKLAVAAAALYGLFALLGPIFAVPKSIQPLAPLRDGSQYLIYNLALLLWFLVCAGVVYLAILDQRYRCRVCLRRLRMPVATGSWSRMLQFGRPRIEYICTYGHGTLKEDALRISGLDNPEWTPHSDDFWGELCASSEETDKQP